MPNNLVDGFALKDHSLHNIPMEYSYHFEIDMQPIPKGRPRITHRGHVYTPKKTKDAEGFMQLRLAEQMGDQELLTGPLRARICFFIERPVSHFTSKGNLKKGAPRMPTSKRVGDIDNLIKAILDSGNQVIWEDDSLICDITSMKRYCDGTFPQVILSVSQI